MWDHCPVLHLWSCNSTEQPTAHRKVKAKECFMKPQVHFSDLKKERTQHVQKYIPPPNLKLFNLFSQISWDPVSTMEVLKQSKISQTPLGVTACKWALHASIWQPSLIERNPLLWLMAVLQHVTVQCTSSFGTPTGCFRTLVFTTLTIHKGRNVMWSNKEVVDTFKTYFWTPAR